MGRVVVRLAAVAAAAALAACGNGAIIDVQVQERAPVADAGPDFVARVNVQVTLDGSRSVDPEGAPVAFSWHPPATALGGFPDTTSGAPTFLPLEPGAYEFELAVTAGGRTSPPDTVVVMVVDDVAATPRRGPAAEPRAAGLHHAVFLAASPAGDLHADPPRNVRADGVERAAVFVDLVADPTDDPPAAAVVGLWRVEMAVDQGLWAVLWFPALADEDDTGDVLFGTTLRTTVVAYAVVGETFVLDGSRSHDDGVIRTFTWTQVEGPFKFSTSAGDLLSVVPQTAGTYQFDLVVTDDIGLTSFPRRLTIPVLPVGSVGQGPPVASLEVLSGAVEEIVGGERVWRSRTGHQITLDDDKSASRSGGTLTFSWKQVSGPPATALGLSTPTPTFTPLVPGAYVFELTVTDANGVSDSEQIAVSVGTATADGPVAALAPIPDASLAAGGGVVIVLDGLASTGNGSSLVGTWSQTRGVPFVVDATGPTVGRVVITQPGTYELELTVVDGISRSPPARRTFTVFP